MYLQKYKNDIVSAKKFLATCDTKTKNTALEFVAKALEEDKHIIISENAKDVAAGKENNMSKALLDRLYLDEGRIDGMIKSIYDVIGLEDPVGKSTFVNTLENGLRLIKISVPLGAIAVVYEARPNVTLDSFVLTFKSSNAVLLRGSSNSMKSNIAIENAIKKGLGNAGIPESVIHLVKDTDRGIIDEILTANDVVDLVIPRGGKNLIERVVKNATVPTIKTGEGNNHMYIDKDYDKEMAVKLFKNAKLQRVGVCNAIEKLLLHKDIAEEILPILFQETSAYLEFRTDDVSHAILPNTTLIKEDEWSIEYLDYIIGVKVVTDVDEAIEHINTYGTMHSECIVTNSYRNALKFQDQVDAAAVYVNASTRFTDGGMFGLGAEIGISTQKMHARGPVGLENLVSEKYIIFGDGQIR
ncbi:MAG TPA: glutamate-5-semialdehyde dehydrogenase [Clostridiaceae bacterium]|nr:glutamate-5-semialdehyde dehydrogenase [Clostridiaceae bacterium]